MLPVRSYLPRSLVVTSLLLQGWPSFADSDYYDETCSATDGSCSAAVVGTDDGAASEHGLFAKAVSLTTGALCSEDSFWQADGKAWKTAKRKWLERFPKKLLGAEWSEGYAELRDRIGADEYDKLVKSFISGDQTRAEKKFKKAMLSKAKRAVQVKTDFQSVAIWNMSSRKDGKPWKTHDRVPFALYLDGWIQSSGLDEGVYHSVMVHTAMLAHESPRTVFLGGSGEGLGLREILRHKDLGEVVMVDIDGQFMDACKHALKSWHKGSFDNDKADVRTGDARAYLENDELGRRFDVVILDFNEFYLPGDGDMQECLVMGGLFTREFYGAAKKRLKPDGILLAQMPSHAECAIIQTLETLFKYVRVAAVPMVGFPYNFFIVASDTVDVSTVSAAEINQRMSSRFTTASAADSHYSGELHQALFDFSRALEETGAFPCTGKCVLADMRNGKQACEAEDETEED
eukprot:TRINITY_DN75563_c0_g1_i1.p1 TRINITY_DN75563_c0_g1~~TRINITY_DN75563_c0_g1_i1.p1  ORF type:complete len:488 (+),score=96.34 TRINITY_DN75563_c0_g1_i1:87-1466(+)